MGRKEIGGGYSMGKSREVVFIDIQAQWVDRAVYRF